MRESNAVPSPEVTPNTNITPRGLRIREASAYSGLTHWCLRVAIWQGKLRARKIGKVLIVLREDVDQYLESMPTVEPLQSHWLAARTKT